MKYEVDFSVETNKDIFELIAFLEELLAKLHTIRTDHPNMTLTAVRAGNMTISYPPP